MYVNTNCFLEPFSRVILRDLRSYFPHPIHDERKVYLNSRSFYSVFLTISSIVCHVCTLQQSFRRHTASVETVTSEEVLFNKCNFYTIAYGAGSSDKAPSASPDHDKMVISLLKVNLAPVLTFAESVHLIGLTLSYKSQSSSLNIMEGSSSFNPPCFRWKSDLPSRSKSKFKPDISFSSFKICLISCHVDVSWVCSSIKLVFSSDQAESLNL